MSFIPIEEKDYSDGRTKQQYKDSTDINKLIYKHAKAGTLSHLEQFGGQYGDFTGFDFLEANIALAKGKSIFEQLPAELRKEFGHDPAQFFAFVGGKSEKELREALPDLAKPGLQLPDILKKRAQAPAEPASPPEAGVPSTPTAGTTENAPEAPTGA